MRLAAATAANHRESDWRPSVIVSCRFKDWRDRADEYRAAVGCERPGASYLQRVRRTREFGYEPVHGSTKS
jgi:hypothetical protein